MQPSASFRYPAGPGFELPTASSGTTSLAGLRWQNDLLCFLTHRLSQRVGNPLPSRARAPAGSTLPGHLIRESETDGGARHELAIPVAFPGSAGPLYERGVRQSLGAARCRQVVVAARGAF